jgi:hypothetical protein
MNLKLALLSTLMMLSTQWMSCGPDPDEDGDGSPAGEDCDDTDPLVFPGAPEACDGKDNDCDADVDEDCSNIDADMDGYTGEEDCDDTSTMVYPGAQEYCNGIDDDCDDVVDDECINLIQTPVKPMP